MWENAATRVIAILRVELQRIIFEWYKEPCKYFNQLSHNKKRNIIQTNFLNMVKILI